MEYTIRSHRKGTRKYILFLNRICNSTIFGFVVNSKTSYCQVVVPFTGERSLIPKKNLGIIVKRAKELAQPIWGRQVFDSNVIGK